MDETAKLCPITKDYCISEDCGWWSKCNEQCAIAALADGVTVEMERLNHGIERGNAREKPENNTCAHVAIPSNQGNARE